jgi:glycosyltransferase involved in cell wall biosynthesis
MPTVDVIMPAYNAARFLPMAIESVMAQTFEDWRILLVDDGSTDNTAEVVVPFVERLGPKLRYIRQQNSGVSAARNHAIRNSSAEFLAMLDADDVWLPNRLFESLKCFEKRPQAGLSYGLISRITPAGEIIDTFGGNDSRYADGHIAPHIYMRRVDLPCATVMLRKSCIDEVGMFDETLEATEDRDLWLRIAFRYEVAVTSNVVAYYRTSPDSLTTDPERMLKAQMRFIEKHYGAPGCGVWARRTVLSNIYRQRAETFANRDQRVAAVGSAARALVLNLLDMRNFRTLGSLLLQGVRR